MAAMTYRVMTFVLGLALAAFFGWRSLAIAREMYACVADGTETVRGAAFCGGFLLLYGALTAVGLALCWRAIRPARSTSR